MNVLINYFMLGILLSWSFSSTKSHTFEEVSHSISPGYGCINIGRNTFPNIPDFLRIARIHRLVSFVVSPILVTNEKVRVPSSSEYQCCIDLSDVVRESEIINSAISLKVFSFVIYCVPERWINSGGL